MRLQGGDSEFTVEADAGRPGRRVVDDDRESWLPGQLKGRRPKYLQHCVGVFSAGRENLALRSIQQFQLFPGQLFTHQTVSPWHSLGLEIRRHDTPEPAYPFLLPEMAQEIQPQFYHQSRKKYAVQ